MRKRVRTVSVDVVTDKKIASMAKKERRSYSSQVSVILESYFKKREEMEKGGEDGKEET